VSALADTGLPEAAPRRPLPPFGEEHEALRAEIRSFVAEWLRPHAAEWEEARWFPNEVFERMAELGLLGLKYLVEYGGRGGGYLDDAVLSEELGRCGSGGLAAGIGAHIGIATQAAVPGTRHPWGAHRGARHHRARRRLRRGRHPHVRTQG
jgi:alkylation response protein AidB-like acyl-CoA dehydrogenase